MFFSILLAGLNSSREKMVIKRVESFPIKHPPHPPLILGVGGSTGWSGEGWVGGYPMLCLRGEPVLKRMKLFPCQDWVFMLSAVGGNEEFWGGRERWSVGTPVPDSPTCEWFGDRSNPGCLLGGQG